MEKKMLLKKKELNNFWKEWIKKNFGLKEIKKLIIEEELKVRRI